MTPLPSADLVCFGGQQVGEGVQVQGDEALTCVVSEA